MLGRRTLAEAVTVQAPLRTGANAALPPPTRPYGAASSGVIGLLLGSLLVAAYGSRVLLERYEVASTALQESVEALRSSTEQVRWAQRQACRARTPPLGLLDCLRLTRQLVPIVQRVDRLERSLSDLRSAAASTRDLEDLRRYVALFIPR